jgi:hypothetical protein
MSYLPRLLFVALVMSAAVPARGEEPEASAAPITVATVPFGARTRTWLAFQREIAPARHPRPLPVEAESRGFERYLQSFTHPIPERFDLDRLDVNRR